jgi:hypothetical protein
LPPLVATAPERKPFRLTVARPNESFRGDGCFVDGSVPPVRYFLGMAHGPGVRRFAGRIEI